MNCLELHAGDIYERLTRAEIEILWDDRNLTDQKFADADLIGIPIRLVVSEKTGDKIEWKERAGDEKKLLSLTETIPLKSLNKLKSGNERSMN